MEFKCKLKRYKEKSIKVEKFDLKLELKIDEELLKELAIRTNNEIKNNKILLYAFCSQDKINELNKEFLETFNLCENTIEIELSRKFIDDDFLYTIFEELIYFNIQNNNQEKNMLNIISEFEEEKFQYKKTKKLEIKNCFHFKFVVFKSQKKFIIKLKEKNWNKINKVEKKEEQIQEKNNKYLQKEISVLQISLSNYKSKEKSYKSEEKDEKKQEKYFSINELLISENSKNESSLISQQEIKNIQEFSISKKENNKIKKYEHIYTEENDSKKNAWDLNENKEIYSKQDSAYEQESLLQSFRPSSLEFAKKKKDKEIYLENSEENKKPKEHLEIEFDLKILEEKVIEEQQETDENKVSNFYNKSTDEQKRIIVFSQIEKNKNKLNRIKNEFSKLKEKLEQERNKKNHNIKNKINQVLNEEALNNKIIYEKEELKLKNEKNAYNNELEMEGESILDINRKMEELSIRTEEKSLNYEFIEKELEQYLDSELNEILEHKDKEKFVINIIEKKLIELFNKVLLNLEEKFFFEIEIEGSFLYELDTHLSDLDFTIFIDNHNEEFSKELLIELFEEINKENCFSKNLLYENATFPIIKTLYENEDCSKSMDIEIENINQKNKNIINENFMEQFIEGFSYVRENLLIIKHIFEWQEFINGYEGAINSFGLYLLFFSYKIYNNEIQENKFKKFCLIEFLEFITQTFDYKKHLINLNHKHGPIINKLKEPIDEFIITNPFDNIENVTQRINEFHNIIEYAERVLEELKRLNKEVIFKPKNAINVKEEITKIIFHK